MNLIDIVQEECVVAGAEFANKEAALREVARLSKKSPLLAGVSEATLLEGLKAREALGSTGFGSGIAIPHCRLDSIGGFVVGLISSPDGVDFEASDGQPVRFMAFIIAPEDDADANIRLLSAVSRVLNTPGALDALLAQKTANVLRASFLRLAREDIEAGEHMAMSLFHVFVQDEEQFRGILEILMAAGSPSVVVVDAESTGAYLARMPLFAGIWRERHEDFNRLIVAVIETCHANETVRRIESVTGSLDGIKGVMVTIQNLAYAAGSIGT